MRQSDPDDHDYVVKFSPSTKWQVIDILEPGSKDAILHLVEVDRRL